MKMKLIIIPISMTLLFTACSNSKTIEEPSPPYNASSKETVATNNDSAISCESDIDSKFNEMEQEASEISKNSNKIESGKLYEKIKSIYNDISLIEMNTVSLIININVPYDSPTTSINSLFDIINNICTNCELESKYNSLIFNLKDTNGFYSNLVFTNYTGSQNFTSTEPILFDTDEFSDYEEPLHNTYIEKYSSFDAMQTYNNNLDSIEIE
ncbi:hypothetical protein [Lachnotalea glycerini]|uniref:Lipoprotein n=1 Tax=Lachnotalea glycerini TaxID=1763509 RepID=A0A371J498_9FIRM|nr:hypothetical protein [Lachnotalea glycerini]RDY27508.1 hypothetical protein CG710_020545 [Lachnotalea glycerini]